MAAVFETGGAVTATTTGTDIIGGSNAKSGWTTLIASTGITAKMIWIFSRSEDGTGYLIDIGTGGTPSVLIPDIACMTVGAAGAALQGQLSGPYPCSIASGTQISARVEVDSVAPGNETVSITILLCDTALPVLTSFTYNAYGVSSGTDNKGTTLDPGGTANTKSGTYTPIASSVAASAEWAIFTFGNNENGTATSAEWLVDIATGAASSEVVKVANIYFGASTTSDMTSPFQVILPADIFAGQRVSADCQCSITDATDRLISVTMHTISGTKQTAGGSASGVRNPLVGPIG